MHRYLPVLFFEKRIRAVESPETCRQPSVRARLPNWVLSVIRFVFRCNLNRLPWQSAAE